MADTQGIAKLFAGLGGIIYLLVGILLLIGNILDDILLTLSQISLMGQIGLSLDLLVRAIIYIVLGVLVLSLGTGRISESQVIIGIVLIIIGVVGGGLAGLLTIIGGIFFILAGL